MTGYDPMLTSRANYYGGIAADLSLSVVAIIAGFALGDRVVFGLIAMLVGMVWYSLCEYGIHRWLYHTGANIVVALHARHHADPDLVYGPPFYYSLTIAFVHGALIGAVAGAPLGLVFGGAMLFGYGQQSAIHHAAHRYPHVDVLGAHSGLRRHHAVHHRGGASNFGVSTTLWDRVFGTLSG
jgi:sterol desaturase/sphingolipid hydroxylase (fatty acid hydroxylase superfamily)